LAEPQLKFDFDALERWKTRASKYPLIVALATKYLGIPASQLVLKDVSQPLET